MPKIKEKIEKFKNELEAEFEGLSAKPIRVTEKDEEIYQLSVENFALGYSN